MEVTNSSVAVFNQDKYLWNNIAENVVNMQEIVLYS